MQDVADAAGVGKATVSLALRNDPRLKPATRAKIQAVAEEIGYKANATVATLMAQLRASRTPKYQATLGIINAAKDPTMLKNIPTFRQWVTGSQHRATQLGYSLDHFWLHETGLTAARLTKVLDSRNIRGLIICAVLETGVLPETFHDLWHRYAAVAIGIRATYPPLNCASNDQYSTALNATKEALARGYKRPALVINREVDALVDRRFSAGFWAGTCDLKEKQQVPMFHFSSERMLAFHAWFKEHKPDCILGVHPQIKDWLQSMKEPANDVGLMHLDRSQDLVDWAGMDQNSERVGAAAVDMLVGQLHRNEIGVPVFAKSALVQSTWIDGPSVKQMK